ncbi:MAG: Uma2 family endonuclease, partial [Acidobacteria bacterium]|nr:Uma2 family endonuclease [Acidobacteriota bacterium]
VQEVWRYDGRAAEIFELVGDEYRRREASVAFPFLTAEALAGFIDDSKTMKRADWLRKLRAWARERLRA